MRIIILFCLPFLLLPLCSQAQENLSERKKKAKEYFYNARYLDAFNVLQQAQKNNLEDRETKFLMAVSLYLINRLPEAEAMFQEQVTQKNYFPEAWLYLGRIFHDQNDYLKASEYYKTYLKTLPSDDPNRQLVRDAVRSCSNGIQLQFRPPLAIVENLGNGINTPFDEFGPINSPTSNDRLYFSSSRNTSYGGLRNKNGIPDEIFGRYYSDIFHARFQNGQWKDPENLGYLTNSAKHEVVLDFAPNGRSMYYFRGNTFSQGQIFVDTFSASAKNLTAEIFFGPADAIAGISAPHFVNDTLLVFPSKRPGGLGGMDLYKSVFYQGKWSNPVNLGPDINSPYDESSAFLARDGKSLYFSTNNPKWSIGGFDVLKSVLNLATGRWSTPYNLGLPINSAEDETHFRLARDGYTAYFASSRRDGLGERDIYAAYFFDFLPEMSIVADQQRLSASALDVTPKGNTKPALFLTKIEPIFFDHNEEPIPANHLKQLEELVDFLIRNPSEELLLTGYSQIEQAISARLFNGANAAARVATFLIDRGVPPSSIRARGAISTDMEIALQGVDCRIISRAGQAIEYVAPIGKGPKNIQSATQLVYRLQIANTDSIYRGPLLAQMEFPIVEIVSLPKPGYTYFAGHYITFADALAARNRFGGSEASKIQVRPFVKERLLPNQDLQALTKEFPDLTNYLNFSANK
ncbi:MAG: tetratricopeptide repeat protein [Saprospiraceae bacterium]|jgi:tetratricopeptide (TPR) repeat protein